MIVGALGVRCMRDLKDWGSISTQQLAEVVHPTVGNINKA